MNATTDDFRYMVRYFTKDGQPGVSPALRRADAEQWAKDRIAEGATIQALDEIPHKDRIVGGLASR